LCRLHNGFFSRTTFNEIGCSLAVRSTQFLISGTHTSSWHLRFHTKSFIPWHFSSSHSLNFPRPGPQLPPCWPLAWPGRKLCLFKSRCKCAASQEVDGNIFHNFKGCKIGKLMSLSCLWLLEGGPLHPCHYSLVMQMLWVPLLSHICPSPCLGTGS
jgi:hypothetical protein